MEIENSDLIELETKFNRAQFIQVENPKEAVLLYTDVINSTISNDDVDSMKEDATIALGNIFVTLNDITSIKNLLFSARPFFEKIAKAKSAKIVKILVENALSIKGYYDIKIEICKDCIRWCEEGKRTFLGYKLQCKYATVLYENKQYSSSMDILLYLIKCLTQIDDKALLIDCYLLQANIFHDLLDYTKAKSCLTQAKMLLSNVYIEPLTQCSIDLLSGIVASYQNDYYNAYAYLLEAYDGYKSIKNTDHIKEVVNYMLLMKILSKKENEITALLQHKMIIDNYNDGIVLLKTIYNMMKKKDLKGIEHLIQTISFSIYLYILYFYIFLLFKVYYYIYIFLCLNSYIFYPVFHYHIQHIQEDICEQVIHKIIKPFSIVYINYISNAMQLTDQEVESKLSQMILDKKLEGVIDQETKTFIYKPLETTDKVAEAVYNSLTEVNNTIDVLATKINNYSSKLQNI
ncbi:hypothetical protein WA158_002687 [Blastocystis sp. Blastoise]